MINHIFIYLLKDYTASKFYHINTNTFCRVNVDQQPIFPKINFGINSMFNDQTNQEKTPPTTTMANNNKRRYFPEYCKYIKYAAWFQNSCPVLWCFCWWKGDYVDFEHHMISHKVLPTIWKISWFNLKIFHEQDHIHSYA